MDRETEDSVILVGYTTAQREDAERFFPEFKPNANVVKEETKREQIRRKREKFAEDCGDRPWLGGFQEIVLYDCGTDNWGWFLQPPELRGEVVAGAGVQGVSTWLKVFTAGWFSEWSATPGPRCRLAGFRIQRFLSMLGLAAAECGRPLPWWLWCEGDSEQYGLDIERLLLPLPQCRDVELSTALLRLGLSTEVGESPEHDVRLAAEVLHRLRLFPKLSNAGQLVPLGTSRPSKRTQMTGK
jgi:hypothetical protein